MIKTSLKINMFSEILREADRELMFEGGDAANRRFPDFRGEKTSVVEPSIYYQDCHRREIHGSTTSIC